MRFEEIWELLNGNFRVVDKFDNVYAYRMNFTESGNVYNLTELGERIGGVLDKQVLEIDTNGMFPKIVIDFKY